MVNTEIPRHYAASPGSFVGTPQVTINHETTLDLDSTNAFEGPEKLLEVWFSASAQSLPPTAKSSGLKAVSVDTWHEMLDLVNCKVLSVVESEQVDAYLLSESSMFVFPHKLILKTCGTTTLLNGLPRILEIAAEEAGFPLGPVDSSSSIISKATPYRVFYSRKNFLFPDRQQGPHRSWRDEVKTLDRLFLGGSAYVIGKLNGEHWYLYVTEPNRALTPPRTPVQGQPAMSSGLDSPGQQIHVDAQQQYDDDETLEILMTDLDSENAKQFSLEHANSVADGIFFEQAHAARKQSGISDTISITTRIDACKEANSDDIFDTGLNESSNSQYPERADESSTSGHRLGTIVSEYSGLADLYPASKYPDAKIDAYLFTPCGFSANGVIPANTSTAKATHYFTVHVTPEPDCSYASFESNVPHGQSGRETADIIAQVVKIFQPGHFSVTLFEGKRSWPDTSDNDEERTDQRRFKNLGQIPGYKRLDRIVHDLDGYDLVFKYYERCDWPSRKQTAAISIANEHDQKEQTNDDELHLSALRISKADEEIKLG